MSSELTVQPAVLLIDTDAGQSDGEVRVRYTNAFHPDPAFLWERTVGQRWQRIDLEDDPTATPDGGSFDRGGRFSRTVALGEVYEAALYHSQDFDPNQDLTDPPPDDRGTAVAVKKPPVPRGLVTNEEHGPGGTYFLWDAATNEPTFAVLEVSAEAPVFDDALGVWHFAQAPTIGSATSDRFATSHQLVVASEGLLPGHEYFAVLRIVDASGNWQVLPAPDGSPADTQPFTTKQRKITVDYKWLHIINDGSPGHNDATFRVWVTQGATAVDAHELPWREITDRPSPGEESMEWINLFTGPTAFPQLVLGPAPVTPAELPLRLLTRGLAKDTTGTDDPAANFLPGPGIVPGSPFPGAAYRFRIGPDEDVEEDEHYVRATPLEGDDEFSYSVEIAVTVEHV